MMKNTIGMTSIHIPVAKFVFMIMVTSAGNRRSAVMMVCGPLSGRLRVSEDVTSAPLCVHFRTAV